MPKYLDSTGLAHFWSKIKSYFDSRYIKTGSALFTTNCFAPSLLGNRSLYISKLDNAFYSADKRFTVSGTLDGTPIPSSSLATLFDGSYETRISIADGSTAIVSIDFSDLSGSRFPGYAYGYIYVSFYYVAKPASVSMRAYNNFASQGVGWHNLHMSIVSDSNGSHIYRFRQSYYGLQTIELTVVGEGTNNYGQTEIAQVEMWLDRPDPRRTPLLSKYGEEQLYFPLTAPNFKGQINGHTVSSDVPANAIFTDTTYDTMTQAQATAGTSTDGMLISPKVLIDTIGSNVTVVVEDNKIKITSR